MKSIQIIPRRSQILENGIQKCSAPRKIKFELQKLKTEHLKHIEVNAFDNALIKPRPSRIKLSLAVLVIATNLDDFDEAAACLIAGWTPPIYILTEKLSTCALISKYK